jgi:hypothetical protein
VTPTQHHDVLQRLGRASGDVRAARARLREEQQAAWRHYVTTVEAALADDLDLTEPGNEDDTGSAGSAPIHELLETFHGRVDDLRVRAQLGRMEAEDLIEELQLALGSVLDHLKR